MKGGRYFALKLTSTKDAAAAATGRNHHALTTSWKRRLTASISPPRKDKRGKSGADLLRAADSAVPKRGDSIFPLLPNDSEWAEPRARQSSASRHQGATTSLAGCVHIKRSKPVPREARASGPISSWNDESHLSGPVDVAAI